MVRTDGELDDGLGFFFVTHSLFRNFIRLTVKFFRHRVDRFLTVDVRSFKDCSLPTFDS